jgi:hypothetical protein
MLPGLRTLLISTIVTLGIALAVMSLMAAYLPIDGARERSAAVRSSDPHRMHALESKARARRYEELLTAIRIGPPSAQARVPAEPIAPVQIAVAREPATMVDSAASEPAPARNDAASEAPPEVAPVADPPAEAAAEAPVVAAEAVADIGAPEEPTREVTIGPLAMLSVPDAQELNEAPLAMTPPVLGPAVVADTVEIVTPAETPPGDVTPAEPTAETAQPELAIAIQTDEPPGAPLPRTLRAPAAKPKLPGAKTARVQPARPLTAKPAAAHAAKKPARKVAAVMKKSAKPARRVVKPAAKPQETGGFPFLFN